ncbi:MAG: hypothetical protein GFH25_541320n50 [Chloroflexi bacterium AL-N10]|nr:hypothetical protein [Chloroflexi bacterium AL-N1]NOK71555.1 hypothetical protein [Chloroflexi bacterium AL-N10]NOK78901.1 hypothetical protein [Chloroflexi bacterium AL-N5]NOK93346.1 hypothetical protein [Chloroflexi bacterium AL-N15]
MGAFPDPATGDARADSWDLMFNWPNPPSTSFTTIRIGGNDFVYGSAGTLITAPTNVDTRTNRSRWRINDIDTTQELKLVENPQTGQIDAARISYTLRNTASVARAVGLRVMIDTQINDADGAPFRIPGRGIITNETDLLGADVPDNFQVFFQVDNSERVAAGTLVGGAATRPDRLVLANWRRIRETDYAFTPDPSVSFGGDDSAYAVYWNPVTLAPGETLTYATLYGLAEIEADLRPPLALAVSSPATLTVEESQYIPNPFDITATVLNNGTATATAVQATLNLTGTAGLTLVEGEQTQVIGDLPVGEERQVTWRVQAASQGRTETIPFAVVVEATNTTEKVVTRAITLPVVQGEPPPYTRTYYVASPDDESNRQLGCSARQNGERGLVILVFGSPRELGVDNQGQTIYGSRLLTGLQRRISLEEIANAVRGFAEGYIDGCSSSPPPNSTQANLTIIVGTSNSKVDITPDNGITNPVDNPALTADHGAAWAQMINELNAYLMQNYGRKVRAAGGYDAEQEVSQWSSPPPTRAWATGYNSAANYVYFNFGSCDGCPRTKPRSEWTDDPADPDNLFADIPALELAYELFWGLRWGRPLPQIFKAEYASQWYNVKRYGLEEYNRVMFISGVATSCGPTACDFDDPTDWRGKLGTDEFISPNQGWQALYDTMNALFTPEQCNDQTCGFINPVRQLQLPHITDFANGAG